MTEASTPALHAPLGRVLTAMVTPFTRDGDLDLDGAQRVAARLIDDGNDGLVVSGTTGESPTTTTHEDERLLRAVIEAVGDRATIVAGVGTNDTAHSLELARQAEKAGADGLLVVTPYYNKPPQPSLIAHFTAVADATGLPNMLYDIPGRTGTPIHTETLLRLAEHERIVAVKDAKADLAAGASVMADTELAYYSGDDALNLAWLSVGASGVVSVVGHVFAGDYRAMVEAVDRGDLAAARAIDRRLIPAVRAIMSPRSQGAIRSKAVMEMLGVIDSRHTRLPLLPASDEELDELRDGLRAAGLHLEDA